MSRGLMVALLLGYMLILPYFAGFMRQRPVEVKLGYLPHPQVLKLTVGDQRLMVAEVAVLKVLFYFGTLVQDLQKQVVTHPEHANMYRTLETATQLDPYNMDAYYFAQAAFTWELGRIAEVNQLLSWGARHRTWDPWLPFYLGFNHAYFLKDYAPAATYLRQAAEISGNPLFANLAARYFYESHNTALGLMFLETMIAQAKDPAIKRTYQLRRDALQAVISLEQALERYRQRSGRMADNLDELVAEGLLAAIPADPYGGRFYLDPQGRVRTTSKLANPGQPVQRGKDAPDRN